MQKHIHPDGERRSFIKLAFLGMIPMTLLNKFGVGTRLHAKELVNQKSVEEMRPGQVQAAIAKGPYAFVPVSPMIEWHSFHLPLGTDGLIPEEIGRLMTARVGGIWFRPLSLGLDAWRTAPEKEMWGFRQDEKVFGMNFPDLPLKSEYCEIPEMKKIITNRIASLRGIGVKHVFLMNHHGGKGQFKTVEQLGNELSENKIKVHALSTYQFNDLTEKDGFYGVGGHAGYSETTWLQAFRPDLVDLTQQKNGELSVRHTGVLHGKPIIESKWNPRKISLLVAHKLRACVLENYCEYINTQIKEIDD